MKNICILYTGGTIGMESTPSGYAPSSRLQQLIDAKLSGNYLANYHLYPFDNLIDSSNIMPNHWLAMAKIIAENYEKYDGFIILHGTDTMSYSASMLSYMLRNLDKPVIFTGSQIPLSELRSDAINNLIGALQLASDDNIAEVCLYFNGLLLRGNRSVKKNTYHLSAFDSPNYPHLGQVGVGIEINSNYLLPQKKEAPNFILHCNPDPQVAIISFFPGVSVAFLQSILDQPIPALIIQTYGAGNGPDNNVSLLNAIRQSVDKGKIIINTSQCFQGRVNTDYVAGSALEKAGMISGFDATVEALFCKCHHLFSQKLSLTEIKQQLQKNMVGEMSISS